MAPSLPWWTMEWLERLGVGWGGRNAPDVPRYLRLHLREGRGGILSRQVLLSLVCHRRVRMREGEREGQRELGRSPLNRRVPEGAALQQKGHCVTVVADGKGGRAGHPGAACARHASCH